MEGKLKILIAEDLSTDLELILWELKRSHFNFTHQTADNESDFIKILKSFNPGIVLTDYMMPSFTGMQVLKIVKEHDPLIPVIVVTGSMNEETAVECMKAGANDYVIKEHLKRLAPAIEHALKSYTIQKEKIEAQNKLAESEKMFRFIAEKASDLIYIYRLKPKPGFDYVSPSATAISGYSPEEHYANPQLGFKIVHPDDAHLLQEIFDKKNLNSPIVLRWIKKDGKIIWTEQQNVPVYDDAGELVAIHGVARDITLRKLAEIKLKEREQTLSNLIGNLPGFIYRCANDTNWTMLYLSPTVEKITGYTPEELINNQALSYNDIILPEYQKYLWDKWQHVLVNRQKFVDEYEIKTKNGQIRWVREQGSGIFDESGNLLFLEGYITDVTETKQAQLKVNEKEQELREIFNSTQESIIIYDSITQTIVDCNNQTLLMYGYNNKEELIGQPIGFLSANEHGYSPEDVLKWKNKAELKGPQTFRWLGKKRNGETFWVEISLKKTMIGGKERLMAVVRDITERISHQLEIEKREREFHEIFNSTTEAIIIYDYQNNKMVDCNNRAYQMYGYESKAEFLNCSILDLGSSIEPYTNERVGLYSQKAREHGPQRFDWLAKHKTGKPIWVEVTIKATRIGGADRELIVIRDITERKQYEENLIKAKERAEESDRLKSAFLANLSHEIRTPMNAIIGFTDMLKHVNTDAKRIEYVDIIQKSGMRLLDIINETIEIAKLDTGLIKVNPETFDLNQLMQDIYNELKIKVAGKKELELIYLPNHSNDQFTLYTDRVKLQQILTNLITNGIKYTPRGAVSFGYELMDNRVVFNVKDTGIGIDRKNKDLIFKRFYRIENPLTMKVGGIGLGLSIAKAYTELLGGTIELESELGRGTSVTVSLPYVKGEPKTELFVELPAEKLKGDNELILIAEDDEYNFLLIFELLKQFKFKCLRAVNGQEAVELVQKNSNIKLVLMDLKMPIMDGYQAFEQIKKFRPNLPVVAQTAYALGEDMDKIKSYGFNGYIRKPIRKDELLNALSESLKTTE